MDNQDNYFKKIISYNYRGRELKFKAAQNLFSSQVIDYGTQRILRSFIFEKIDNYNKVLDLGSGYGPIGIALKSFNNKSEVHTVDIDSLAIEYSQQNAVLNGYADIKIYASLGFDDIKENDFDLIVSNIPAKIGDKALTHVLKDAQFFLKPGGTVAVVVIDAIVKYVSNELTKDPNIKILFHRAWPGHVVYHYKFNEQNLVKPELNAFDRGVFDRKKSTFTIGSLKYQMVTSYGLPEFDTLSFESELIIKYLEKAINNLKINSAAIVNTGQGHIAVCLSKLFNPDKITLIDRNILSLRTSTRNLLLNSYELSRIETVHNTDLTKDNVTLTDCVIGVLDDKENPLVHNNLIDQAISITNMGGTLIFASSSTLITRIETYLNGKKNIEILDRQRIKGKSIVIFKINR